MQNERKGVRNTTSVRNLSISPAIPTAGKPKDTMQARLKCYKMFSFAPRTHQHGYRRRSVRLMAIGLLKKKQGLAVCRGCQSISVNCSDTR